MFKRNGARYARFIAIAAILTLGLPARAAEPVEITFANWAAAESTTRPAIEQLIKDFEAAHPDIKIKSEAISFTEIARQLVLRVRSGNPPDVSEVAGNDTILVAQTGKLEPLDAYVTADVKGALKPGVLDQFRVKNQLIAFPWVQAPAGL